MKSLLRLFAAVSLPLLLVLAIGCSGPVTKPTKTLTSIAVTPANPAHLKVGATQQFTATGTFSDGSTSDITSTVTWTSGTTATATITASGGLATGVAAGTTQITATQGSVVSPGVTLTVIALTSIDVTPHAPPTIAINATQQFTATGTYSDASTSDISSQVTWSCLPVSTATISATGLATGVANGTAQVSAKLGTIPSNSVTLTVGTGGVPVAVAVKIQQLNPTIPVGGVEDFTVKILFSDGSLQAPTAPVSWTSGTTATATIIASVGIAQGIAAGSSTITASSTGLSSDSTLLTVVPAFTRFAYTAGGNDIAASSYVLNVGASALTPTGIVRDTTKPVQIVPEPSGKFAYGPGANAPGTVALYAVDPKTGILKFSNAYGSNVPNLAPFQSVIDPTGRFLYVTNDAKPGSVAALAINTTSFDGSLTPITGSPFAAGNSPIGIAETPAGTFVYVTNNDDGTISGYSVQSNGSLQPLTPATTATGSGASSFPGLPAIDPTGSFLYVPNSGDGTISVFSIAANGALTPVTGSPFSTGVGSSPVMVAIAPSGKFLYATDQANNQIVGFTIGTGATAGQLTAATASSPYATGNAPLGIAIDGSSSSLVVANQSDNTLTYYSINSTTGQLTTGQTVQTRALPFLVNFGAGTATPSIAPATVEAANSGSATPGTGSVTSYTVNAGTGALTTAATSPTLDGNNQVATSTSGQFFYTATSTGKQLDGFSVSPAAALTGFSTNATNLGTTVPSGLYAEPEDRFLYVADSAGATVVTFKTNASTGITPNGVSGSLTSVNSLAGDSQGLLLVSFGSNTVQSLLIDQSNGQAGVGPAAPAAPGSWTAGAIDPSGRFVVAADSTGHQISTFAITPLSGGLGTDCVTPPFQDGCVTIVPSTTVAVGTGLNGPYAVTFDALGRFVFVADKASGSIAVFTFDPSTGKTTAAAGSPVSVSAQGITNVAVEANGKFLYVGIKGNGTTAGTVAVYSINATTGALTVVGTPINAGINTAAVSVTNSVN